MNRYLKLIAGLLAVVVLCGFGSGGGSGGGGGGGGTTITSGAGDFGVSTSQSGGVLTGSVTQVNGHAPTTNAVANQFATSSDSSGRLTLAQPSFSNLSGNPAVTQLPAITMSGTPTTANGSAETSQTVNTVSGASGTLFLCATATITPTSVVACPSTGTGTWTTLIQGGSGSGASSRTTLCACAASSCTDGSYSISWTGSSFGSAAEVALTGLTAPLVPDRTFANAATTQALSGGAPSSGSYTTADYTIMCAQGGSGTPVMTLWGPTLIEQSSQNALLGGGFGLLGGGVTATTSSVLSIVGVQVH